MTEENAHLLKYCVIKTAFASNGPINYKYNYPFPQHITCQHWEQNTPDLHRHNTNTQNIPSKNPEDDSLSEEDLKRLFMMVGRSCNFYYVKCINLTQTLLVQTHFFEEKTRITCTNGSRGDLYAIVYIFCSG